jgi:hypothetical protein
MVAEGCCESASPGNEELTPPLIGSKNLRRFQGRELPEMYPMVFTALKPSATTCNPFGIRLVQTDLLRMAQNRPEFNRIRAKAQTADRKD